MLHTETYFNIVKNIFVNSTSSEERVATFYLMYALYFKQPTKDFCKFRFTCSNWELMKSFYHLIHNNEQYQQAQHIFWRLWLSDAFRFVESDNDYCPDIVPGCRSEDDGPNGFFKVNGAVLNSVHNWQNEGILSALETLEVGYNEMKEHLTSTAVCTLTSTQPMKGIMATVDNVKKLFSAAVPPSKRTHAERDTVSVTNSNVDVSSDNFDDSDITSDSELDEATGDDDPVEDAELDIGLRRYEIKQRALGQFAGEMLKFRSSMHVAGGDVDAKQAIKQNDSDEADALSITDELEPPDRFNGGETDVIAAKRNINFTENGDIVINRQKREFNRLSKEYVSSVRRQIASCPE